MSEIINPIPPPFGKPREDDVTKMIADFCNASDFFRRRLLGGIKESYARERWIRIENHQRLDAPGKHYGGKVPDLLLRSSSASTEGIIEVKIDARETCEMCEGKRIPQVKVYESYLKDQQSKCKADVFLATLTVCVPTDQDFLQAEEMSVTRLTFTDIAQWLDETATDQAPHENGPDVQRLARKWADHLRDHDLAIPRLTKEDIDAFVDNGSSAPKKRINAIFRFAAQKAIATAHQNLSPALLPVTNWGRPCELPPNTWCWRGPKLRRNCVPSGGATSENEVIPCFIYGVEEKIAFLKPVILAGTNFHAAILVDPCAAKVTRDPFGWGQDMIEFCDLAVVVRENGRRLDASDWERVVDWFNQILGVLAKAGTILDEN